MNSEHFDSTEDDWIPQKWSNIPASPTFLPQGYSSPILLGKHDSKMNITPFSLTDEQFNFQESYDMNNSLVEENLDLEQLLNFTPIIIQNKRIGKQRKRKVNSKKGKPMNNKEQQCHTLVQDMMKITNNKEDAWIQLKQCQQGKQFIDQLERVLLSMKSVILNNIQIRQSQ